MDLHEMIRAEIVKTQQKMSRAGFPSFPIPFEVVESMKNLSLIAWADYSGKLSFNFQFFQFPDDIPFAQLVAHEVAHLYQFKHFPGSQGHGREFRRIMKFLGFSGNARVQVTGQAAKAADERRAAVTVARKPKTKTRHVYLTEHTGKEIFLTVHQHYQNEEYFELNGRNRYTYNGEKLIKTGKVKTFK